MTHPYTKPKPARRSLRDALHLGTPKAELRQQVMDAHRELADLRAVNDSLWERLEKVHSELRALRNGVTR